MTIYQVWDYDPMASSMGGNYCAATFREQTEAFAECERRNVEWREHFIKIARCGEQRADLEPWNWRYAYIREGELL